MKYYKLINGENFVGVGTSLDMRMFQLKHRIILACTEEQAQYIQCNDQMYRALWMVPVNNDKISYETLDVILIEKEEYDILYEAIESGEDIVIEPEETPEVNEEVFVDPNTEVTVEYVKSAKVAELSAICNKVIENGVDVTLSDGVTYHYSLTTQDQLNLITLSTMIASGENAIPYHADGELCRYYSAADATAIMNAATAFKTYHVTYFNSLKVYVNSLDNIADVSAIQYGVTIPEEYQSDILKDLIAQMAGGNA